MSNHFGDAFVKMFTPFSGNLITRCPFIRGAVAVACPNLARKPVTEIRTKNEIGTDSEKESRDYPNEDEGQPSIHQSQSR